jgi:hypothetical protein
MATRPKARESLRHCAVGSYKHFFHEEFVEQRTLAGLLRESRAQRIGHFENSSGHSLGQSIEVSVLIGVHQPAHHHKAPLSTKALPIIIGRR